MRLRESGGVEVAVGDILRPGRGAQGPGRKSGRKKQICSLSPSPNPQPPGFMCEFRMDCLTWKSSASVDPGPPVTEGRVTSQRLFRSTCFPFQSCSSVCSLALLILSHPLIFFVCHFLSTPSRHSPACTPASKLGFGVGLEDLASQSYLG